ncbi:glycosyltransferase family 2 protein [Poriferisphaera sp. WC338]|uniref:glycosyltransferase family 2 protein n=1 Tax=Poriferisphaera sp. WC338 TaxID=3425129 RepID=UPI003D814568
MHENINLLVVIVCYRAVDLTIDCLRSIGAQIHDTPGVHVAVCENGTSEEAAKKLADAIELEGWSDWCWLKVITPNRGFSGGNNVILEEAMKWDNPPKNYLLLNADTVVRPGALKTLMEVANSHSEAGIISPRLEWPDGEAQISCFRYINPVSEMINGAHTSLVTKLFRRFDVPIPVSEMPTEPQWTTFACALIRHDVMEQIGVLDPGYFLYFDDPDYCRRARKAGWKVLNWPQARVVHLRGQSNPVKELTANLGKRPSYYYASRARYLAKFYGRPGLWLSNVLWSCGRILALLREKIGRKQPHVCEDETKDIWMNWSHPMRTTGRLGDDSA